MNPDILKNNLQGLQASGAIFNDIPYNYSPEAVFSAEILKGYASILQGNYRFSGLGGVCGILYILYKIINSFISMVAGVLEGLRGYIKECRAPRVSREAVAEKAARDAAAASRDAARAEASRAAAARNTLEFVTDFLRDRGDDGGDEEGRADRDAAAIMEMLQNHAYEVLGQILALLREVLALAQGVSQPDEGHSSVYSMQTRLTTLRTDIYMQHISDRIIVLIGRTNEREGRTGDRGGVPPFSSADLHNFRRIIIQSAMEIDSSPAEIEALERLVVMLEAVRARRL